MTRTCGGCALVVLLWRCSRGGSAFTRCLRLALKSGLSANTSNTQAFSRLAGRNKQPPGIHPGYCVGATQVADPPGQPIALFQGWQLASVANACSLNLRPGTRSELCRNYSGTGNSSPYHVMPAPCRPGKYCASRSILPLPLPHRDGGCSPNTTPVIQVECVCCAVTDLRVPGSVAVLLQAWNAVFHPARCTSVQ
jgi:hypothetical protein